MKAIVSTQSRASLTRAKKVVNLFDILAPYLAEVRIVLDSQWTIEGNDLVEAPMTETDIRFVKSVKIFAEMTALPLDSTAMAILETEVTAAV